MHKTLSVLLLIALVQMPLLARKPHIGVKGGIQLSDTWGPQSNVDGSLLVGLAMGVPFIFHLQENLKFQPELLFSLKGARKDTTDIDKFPVVRRLLYLQAPLIAKLYLHVGSAVKPAVYIGPSVGYLFKADRVVKKRRADGGSDNVFSILDQANPIDVGVVLGCGVDLQIGKHELLMDLRGDFGLLPWHTERTTRNMSAAATIGIAFNLEREKQWW